MFFPFLGVSFIKLTGTYLEKRPNGVRFFAEPATSEFSKRWEPKEGDIVSFKHRGFLLNSKKPKLPTLYRLRPDMKWDDVIQRWKEKTPSTGNTNVVALLNLFFLFKEYPLQYDGRAA